MTELKFIKREGYNENKEEVKEIKPMKALSKIFFGCLFFNIALFLSVFSISLAINLGLNIV